MQKTSCVKWNYNQRLILIFLKLHVFNYWPHFEGAKYRASSDCAWPSQPRRVYLHADDRSRIMLLFGRLGRLVEWLVNDIVGVQRHGFIGDLARGLNTRGPKSLVDAAIAAPGAMLAAYVTAAVGRRFI